MTALTEDLHCAGEAGAERLLQRHVEVAEGFELASARERTGVDGAQTSVFDEWLTVRLASSSSDATNTSGG